MTVTNNTVGPKHTKDAIWIRYSSNGTYRFNTISHTPNVADTAPTAIKAIRFQDASTGNTATNNTISGFSGSNNQPYQDGVTGNTISPNP